MKKMKNHAFRRRLGYALTGIRRTFRSEKSFRTQAALGLAGAGAVLWLQPGPVWTALVVLASAHVLGLELVNTALEAALDRIHPGQHPAVGAAKDAAAAAVLVASVAAAAVGVLMVVSAWRA